MYDLGIVYPPGYYTTTHIPQTYSIYKDTNTIDLNFQIEVNKCFILNLVLVRDLLIILGGFTA